MFRVHFQQYDPKQGVDVPILTRECLKALWKTYYNEHYYARGARVANLDESSAPPQPDGHPCGNFGIVLAKYELENGKEAAKDETQLMERIAEFKSYAWPLALPVPDDGELASWLGST